MSDNLKLYAVTDRAWTAKKPLPEQIEDALKGGVTCLQLREKDLPFEEFLAEAKVVGELCRKYGVPFIVNDSVNIAAASGADGVHIGQSDIAVENARAALGTNKIIGVSAQTVVQAVAAEKAGANYLGVGAVFTTSTKLDATVVSFGALKEICAAVSIPIVAIGGITAENLPQLKGSGIAGVAVVSAIFAQNDIQNAAEKLLSVIGENLL